MSVFIAVKKSKVRKRRKLIPLPKLLKKAEKVFNAYVRRRDYGLQCISLCGNPGDQAGHYFPVNYSGVRFNEYNVNMQESGCNKWKYGNQAMYRIGLVEKYGERAVNELEAEAVATKHKKWGREELLEIIEKYKETKGVAKSKLSIETV